MKELKQQIIKVIETESDKNKIESIHTFVFKDEIENLIDELLILKKLNKPGVKRDLMSFILSGKGSLQDKVHFLQKTIKEGYVDESKIKSLKTPTHVSKISKNIPFLTHIMEDLVKWTNKEMDKTGVGAGEAFLILGINGATKAPQGDVVTTKNNFELKSTNKKGGGSGARFKGQGSHWALTPSVFKSFFKKLQSITSNDISKDPNLYNFNSKGIKSLNDLFKKYNASDNSIIDVMKIAIVGVYTSATKAELQFLNKTIKRGTIQEADFIVEFAAFQFEYYRRFENFDGVIFTNGASLNFLYIENKSGFIKSVKAGHLKVDTSWNWKQAQNNTYQIGVI